MALIKFTSLLLLARFLTKPSIGRLIAVGLTMLIGVWDKFNFLWFVASSAVTVAVIYRSRWWPWLRANRKAWIALVVLALPLVAFAGYARTVALSELMPASNPLPLREKLASTMWIWRGTFEHTFHLWRITSRVPAVKWPTSAWLALDALAVLLALLVLATRKRPHLQRRFLAGVALAIALVSSLIFLQMVFTPHRIGPHHMMILWPFHQWLAVLGLVLLASLVPSRLHPRMAIGLLLACLIVLQIWSSEKQVGDIERDRVFAVGWDPRITELASYLRAKAEEVDSIVFIQYGTSEQVRALWPRDRISRLRNASYQMSHLGTTRADHDAIYAQILADRTVLVVVSAVGDVEDSTSAKNILALLQEHSCEWRPVKAWNRDSGGPVYSVLYARCPPLRVPR
jgi:hypothetical protein